MPVIEIANLSKNFGSFTALHNVNLTVHQGEVVGFIGPNGAGKSTTIRILLGLLRPSSGSVRIFNKDAFTQAIPIHKKMAYVPGDVTLWPNLTGGQVIDILLQMNGPIPTQRRDELITLFQLDPTKKCQTYSKGNRQKIALIAALATEADLYIFDEPTSGLDPLMERVFQQCVKELQHHKKTILLSSHILSEVERLCDKIAIIKDGTIIETGSLQTMQHVTRALYTVDVQKPLDDLYQQAGVFDIQQDGLRYTFYVDNSAIPHVMTYLAMHHIVSITSMPLTLEDLFMAHYKKGGD